ncbi:hypothetical protein P280DRAFT_481649 [Massarina eburnea CBS 473.64]|uniref:Uncharacterized protein n=1 Tax=Massarina eburnea CBS 473.64 TaxID=1395130 RepID=A0A6A6RVU5_9PLEO|nr:hypothetical protein P280DRAFT_481649 [Massarina eburnea CBS 473.64]
MEDTSVETHEIKMSAVQAVSEASSIASGGIKVSDEQTVPSSNAVSNAIPTAAPAESLTGDHFENLHIIDTHLLVSETASPKPTGNTSASVGHSSTKPALGTDHIMPEGYVPESKTLGSLDEVQSTKHAGPTIPIQDGVKSAMPTRSTSQEACGSKLDSYTPVSTSEDVTVNEKDTPNSSSSSLSAMQPPVRSGPQFLHRPTGITNVHSATVAPPPSNIDPVALGWPEQRSRPRIPNPTGPMNHYNNGTSNGPRARPASSYQNREREVLLADARLARSQIESVQNKQATMRQEITAEVEQSHEMALHEILADLLRKQTLIIRKSAELTKKEKDIIAREQMCQKLEEFLAAGQAQFYFNFDGRQMTAAQIELIRTQAEADAASKLRSGWSDVQVREAQLQVHWNAQALREREYRDRIRPGLEGELRATLESEIEGRVSGEHYDRGFGDGKEIGYAAAFAESNRELQDAAFIAGYKACRQASGELEKLRISMSYEEMVESKKIHVKKVDADETEQHISISRTVLSANQADSPSRQNSNASPASTSPEAKKTKFILPNQRPTLFQELNKAPAKHNGFPVLANVPPPTPNTQMSSPDSENLEERKISPREPVEVVQPVDLIDFE